MGKRALLAAWLTLREAAGDRVPHHFIRRGEYGWDDQAKLVDSLVAQIAARFPDQAEPEADAHAPGSTTVRVLPQLEHEGLSELLSHAYPAMPAAQVNRSP